MKESHISPKTVSLTLGRPASYRTLISSHFFTDVRWQHLYQRYYGFIFVRWRKLRLHLTNVIHSSAAFDWLISDLPRLEVNTPVEMCPCPCTSFLWKYCVQSCHSPCQRKMADVMVSVLCQTNRMFDATSDHRSFTSVKLFFLRPLQLHLLRNHKRQTLRRFNTQRPHH